MHHRQRLPPRPLILPKPRLLQFLVELRRQLVQQKVRTVQRLTDSVQQYFPQARTWFVRLDSPLIDALLERWPTLPELQRSHPAPAPFLPLRHNCRKDELIRQRIDAVYAAVPATTDPVVLEAGTRKSAACLGVLRQLRQQIDDLDQRIAALVAVHPDAPLFASFPGAGAVTVPRLIAAFGTCRQAWSSAADLQRFSGIAPVHKSSGKSTSVVMRRACPKFLRQTFHEFAGQSIPWSAWAKAYYLHQRQDNKLLIMPRCARWPFAGFGFSTAAGRTSSPTTSASSWTRSAVATPGLARPAPRTNLCAGTRQPGSIN